MPRFAIPGPDRVTLVAVFSAQPLEPTFPIALSGLKNSPGIFYWKGETIPKKERLVAIVGSRSASRSGLGNAFSLAEALAKNGFGVMSGGALGIDTQAHLGALEGGGYTCAVLPASLKFPYPGRNRPLFKRILESGGTICSSAPNEEPRPFRFVHRNSYLAAMSKVVVVAEARAQSGSFSTMKAALAIGRRVIAFRGVQCPPAMSKKIVRVGSVAEAMEIVLENKGGKIRQNSSPQDKIIDPTLEELAILKKIHTPQSPAQLAIALKINLRSLTPSLIMLELRGFASRDSAGRYISTHSEE